MLEVVFSGACEGENWHSKHVNLNHEVVELITSCLPWLNNHKARKLHWTLKKKKKNRNPGRFRATYLSLSECGHRKACELCPTLGNVGNRCFDTSSPGFFCSFLVPQNCYCPLVFNKPCPPRAAPWLWMALPSCLPKSTHCTCLVIGSPCSGIIITTLSSLFPLACFTKTFLGLKAWLGG